MKKTTAYFRLAPMVLAVAAAVGAGCASPYVDPGSTNPVSPGAYTRSETLTTEQRLVGKLFSDAVFARHYAAKVAEKGGTAPVLQVAYIDNLTTRHVPALDAVRRDLETALRTSGRFVLSGDADACDYILRGEYRDIPDGRRVGHQLALQLHDTAADMDVWTGADEIAKE